MDGGVKFNIDSIKTSTGKPLEPRKNATKFKNQCGVIVRDQIPISVQEWKKPAKRDRAGVTFVDERAKDVLWNMLMEHFTLPDNLTDADLKKVGNYALKKMAIAFNTFKKNAWTKYVKSKRRLQNSREHW